MLRLALGKGIKLLIILQQVGRLGFPPSWPVQYALNKQHEGIRQRVHSHAHVQPGVLDRR